MTDLLDGPARRPRPPRATSSGAPSTGSAPTAGRRPRPRAGWTVATQVAHLLWTDEVAVLAAHSHERPSKAGVGRRRARGDRGPDGLRRRRRLRGRRGCRATRRCWPAGPHGRDGAAAGAARAARGPEDAVVRPADVGRVDGDRAVHGDLGARARRLRRRSATDARADRPDPARRPPRRAHPQLRLLGARAWSRRPRSSASSWPRPSGELWTWGPEDAAQTVTGSAYDFCLLVTQRVHRADTDLVAVGADAEQWLASPRRSPVRPATGGRRRVTER